MANVVTTARDIITLAMKEAGILGVGQTALAEDMTDGFTYLSRMMAAWQVERWMIPALIDIKITLSSKKSYTIGVGGDFNITRPNDIKGAYIVQLNTGTTPVSLQMAKIFSYEDYIRIAVKDLNSLPDHFFYDAAWAGGLGNIFFWPIGNSSYEAHILVEAQLSFPLAAQNPPAAGTGLDTVFSLPPEYLEAIHYNLAIRMFSGWQIPQQASTMLLAKTSLKRIKTNNSQIPSLGMPPGLRRGKAFNLFNADGY